MRLNSRTILITGAAGGLGSTAALALAAAGAQIILLDKNLRKLEQVYDAIVEQGSPEPILYPFDLAGANEVQYQELADAIQQRYGSLQGLLHAASEFSAFTPLSIHKTLDWGHTLNVNLNAPFLLSRVLLPVLQNSPTPATIVFLSDSSVREAKAYSGAYGVSKIALEGYAKILAEELDSAGKVRVHTLVPGPIDSPLRKKAYPAEDKSALPSMSSLAPLFCHLFSGDCSVRNGQSIEAASFIA
jgi:NAD(P)-dependent dehydrogenase (short-subunit alcohol dehydrogenase family)